MFAIHALTSKNRLQVTQLVESALAGAGADILDFHQFSNISLTLTCEIRGDRIDLLVKLVEQSGCKVAKVQVPETLSCDVITGFLVLTFIHNEPDLRVEVPAVPG